jgi:membrane protein implicated in regulation of membrane protease activity
MDSGWLSGINYWHWWVLGVVFVILEIFSPAAFFLWMGIAAGVVGLLLLAMPDLAWEWQILAFALLSVASIVLGRSYLKRHPIKTDQPTLNRRGEQYLGRVFTLDQPIVNGVGKIHVDDTSWKINGPECDAGVKVTVTGVDGVVLRVECSERSSD